MGISGILEMIDNKLTSLEYDNNYDDIFSNSIAINQDSILLNEREF